MAFEILDVVLEFSVDGFAQLFKDLGARRLRPSIMGFHILHEHGQALSSESKVCRAAIARLASRELNPSIPKSHLCSRDWIPVPILLDKAKRRTDPIDRSSQV